MISATIRPGSHSMPALVGRAAAYLRYPRITWKRGSPNAKTLVLAAYAAVASYAVMLAFLGLS
jgi:hypothetical protein